MADQLQLRGGTTSEHSTFTGALREITVDTTKKTLVVHDAVTAGGIPLARQDLNNVTLPAGSTSVAGVLQLTNSINSTSTTTAATPSSVKTAYDLAASAAPLNSPTFTGNVTIPAGASITNYATLNTNQTFTATKVFASGQVYPQIPANSQTSAYTLVASDAGKHISITAGGVTIPSGVFVIGDAISIFNNSTSNQTITQGASVTLRQAGTANTGNRLLAQYGVCTVLCVANNVFTISGAGLS